MKTVPLYGRKAAGRVAIVDDEDYELVSRYRWTVWEVPEKNWGPYPIANVGRGRADRRTVLMHKLLTGYPLTDHENGDGLDNRRVNLRKATRGQNRMNEHRSRGGASRFKGVCWHPATRKWRARIKHCGQSRSLGLFVSEEDAARAYDRAAVELFGEFARPNFPH